MRWEDGIARLGVIHLEDNLESCQSEQSLHLFELRQGPGTD
jgi:hypothetical protein